MKKLMFASVFAIGAAGAFADPELPAPEVARVYQMQMDVYTTKGVAKSFTITGSACAPGESACLVMRGKDTTMFRGYLYVCGNVVNLVDYSCVMADVRRKAIFEDCYAEWDILNIFGPSNSDAESVWDFCGYLNYDEARAQEYELRCAGYGVFRKAEDGSSYYDDFSGNFAGMATASYDLTTKAVGDIESCVCNPSQVLVSDSYEWLEFCDSDTLAFGTWKLKYNAELSAQYAKWGYHQDPTGWIPEVAVRALIK